MKLVSALVLSAFFVGNLQLANAAQPEVQVQSSIVTSGASLALGQRIPVQNFKTEDYVISSVVMHWAPATESAGRHLVEHRWLQNGTLISEGKRVIAFNKTPINLYSRRPAVALGQGHFEVQTLMDGQIVGDEQFDITE